MKARVRIRVFGGTRKKKKKNEPSRRLREKRPSSRACSPTGLEMEQDQGKINFSHARQPAFDRGQVDLRAWWGGKFTSVVGAEARR
jgi:hypothetical protein